MKIEIKFTDSVARQTEYLLQKKYHSKARLQVLAKIAILTEAANQAKTELVKL